MGKEISGTGMDTNVLGRYQFLDEDEPDSPDIRRIYVRTITSASHGNGLGMGLADFAHENLVEQLDLTDTYLNTVTSGEPSRAHIPIVSPSDRTTLLLAYSMTGVRDPEACASATFGTRSNRTNCTSPNPSPMNSENGTTRTWMTRAPSRSTMRATSPSGSISDRTLVVADDLTGATDTGHGFAVRGFETVVRLDPEFEAPDAAVIVVDTDSRYVSPAEAGNRVADVVSDIEAATVYKKVDSTLRGNLAAEIEAVMAAMDADTAAVAPAFPTNGRVTACGYHLVEGALITDTEAGNDPDSPVCYQAPRPPPRPRGE